MRKSSAIAVRVCRLSLLLWTAAVAPAMAQHPDDRPRVAPDVGWHERDYLLHYATVVCVHGAYGTLTPPPGPVLKALDQEAWAMVEFTRQTPETYEHIHRLAADHGKAEAPEQALAACGAWAKREAEALLKTSTEHR